MLRPITKATAPTIWSISAAFFGRVEHPGVEQLDRSVTERLVFPLIRTR
jgi:hypothetical protein